MYRDRSCGGVERFPVSFCLLEPIGSNRCGWALLPPEPAHAGHAQGYVRGYVQGTCRACMGYVRCPQNFPRRQLLTHVAKWHAGKGQEDSEGVCVCVYACSKYAWVSMATCGYVWVCVGMRGYVGVSAGFVQDMCGNVWACFNMCGASILHIPMVFAFPTLDCFGFLLAFGSYPVYGQHTK